MTTMGDRQYTPKVYAVYVLVRAYSAPWKDQYPEEETNVDSVISICKKIFEWARLAVAARPAYQKVLPDLDNAAEVTEIFFENPWAFYCSLSRTTKNYMVGVKAEAWAELEDNLYQQDGSTAEEVMLAKNFQALIENGLGPEYEKEMSEKHKMMAHVHKGMQESRKGFVVDDDAGKGKGQVVLQPGPQRPRLDPPTLRSRAEVEERDLLGKIEELKRQVEEANARNIDRNAVPRDTSDDAQGSQMQNMTPVPQTWKGKGHQPPRRPPVPTY